MDKIKFLDTNAILKLDLESLEEKIYLSSITLQELEHIKTSRNKDEQVKYEARKSCHWLQDNEDKYECIVADSDVYDYVDTNNLETDNDNLIIASAIKLQKQLGKKVTFITDDVCCYNIAKNIFGLECEGVTRNKNENYKGYQELYLNMDEIMELYSKYDKGDNYLNLIENEYLIIHETDIEKTVELRYSKGKFVPLKLPPSKVIKGLNEKQRLALDLLNNKDIPIKIIAGTYGSGKTLLSIKSALYQLLDKGSISKIMLVRNPIGSGEEIGYLKGTLEDKTKDFFLPISQNLDGGQYELDDLKMKGMIEAKIPYYMKGMSLQATFVLVDEAEDLDVKTFKLIGTRIGKDSYVAYVGDWKQSETKYVHNNGLSKFINYVKQSNGNDLIGVVVLDDDVRSNASKVFCDFE